MGDKNTLIAVTARAVNSIVTLQQSACSAISRGFEPHSATGSQFFFVASFLQKLKGYVLHQYVVFITGDVIHNLLGKADSCKVDTIFFVFRDF